MQHVKVLDDRKLEVTPPGDRDKLQFELHNIKNMLPNVVVKVSFLPNYNLLLNFLLL